jgi:hypothetical protein
MGSSRRSVSTNLSSCRLTNLTEATPRSSRMPRASARRSSSRMTAGPITIPMAASAQWVDSCSPPTRGSSRMRDKPSAHPAAQRFPDTGKSARQRISLRDCRRGEDPSRVGQQLVVGPAVYGASAFRSYYAIGGNGQGVAALDSLKGTRNSGRQAGVKLGVGAESTHNLERRSGGFYWQSYLDGRNNHQFPFPTMRPDPLPFKSWIES